MAIQETDARPLRDFKLKEVRVSNKTVWRFLTLCDDLGRAGYGDFSYDGAPDDIADRTARFVNSLLGRPAHRNSLPNNWQSLFAAELPTATIYSAVEQALADLEAKVARQPLWEYLGGLPGDVEIPLYANINRRTVDRSPAGFAESAVRALECGFSHIKIAPFDGVSPVTHAADTMVSEGLDRIAAVRAVIGPNKLMVDCHWRFAPSQITALLGKLASLKVSWLECPIVESKSRIDDIVAIRNTANSHEMRLAGLENCAGWDGFRPYLEAGAYDVIMPDIKHCGGHAAFQEIAMRAREIDVAVSAHNPTGPIAHLASLHATAAIGAPEPLEIQFEESPRFYDLTVPPLPPLNGMARPPGGIGLGATLSGELD